MPILAVSGLVKYYGAEKILDGLDLQVERGQRLAVVGRNGCGKTTLLRLIAGEEEADGGTIQIERGLRLGYLAQGWPDADPERTVWEEMEGVFADLARMERELAETAAAMAAPGGAIPRLMARYARLQEEFEERGGYALRHRIEKVLRGVGLSPSDWGKPIGVLSGGETTRAALARLLLRAPDLLLLDEPTNHLDLEAVAWLEEYLSTYKGAVLVVSHDRYFLDRVVEGVYEISEGKARFYPGDYTAYRRQRAERERALRHAWEVQEREIARKERLVRESPADERSKRQARSIAKSIARLPRVEPPREAPRLRIELESTAPPDRLVLAVEGVGKRFGDRVVLDRVSLKIEAGEKVGLIGPNGAGKTTLLRLILGLERPDEGRIVFGSHVSTGYFAQEEEWNAEGTVFSAIQEASGADNFTVRSHLARFLFRGEEVWKEVSALSGGELRRLALARLTLSPANFLLLDEPTNHLDLPSIEALEEALRCFRGSAIVVSHDRYFLGRVTDRLLALVRGRVLAFSGYEEYAAWRAAEEERLSGERAALPRGREERVRVERRNPAREKERRAKAAAAVEAALAAKEEERERLLLEMARPEKAGDYRSLRDLSLRLAALEEEIARLYEEWGELLDGV